MRRIINAILVVMAVVAATWTYTVKHDAEARLSEIRALERDIENYRELINVLHADWAVLTEPGRIETLSRQFSESMALDATASHQITGFDALPGMMERGASEAIEDIIAGEFDPLTTGSVDMEAQP